MTCCLDLLRQITGSRMEKGPEGTKVDPRRADKGDESGGLGGVQDEVDFFF